MDEQTGKKDAFRPKRTSKRFESAGWAERVIPALLLILVIGLVATLVLIGLSVAGLTPSF